MVTKTNANQIAYTPAGGVATTVESKLREFVSVKDFGAVGDGVTDDTAAIQAAINTGKSLEFPEGAYKANNLVGSARYQKFTAVGSVLIYKSASGPLLTHSGDDIEISGISFSGDAATPIFSGDNLVLTGNNPKLINCGSRWAAGRALKATGNHVQIIGTCDIYQTTDATATGYDIEIGVSGKATLYHEIYGVYSSQPTGGIKLIDTGSHTIVGGEFGKLTIAAGTSPSGVNGGKTVAARILGDVSVGLDSAVFSANQFGSVAITLESGTSNCSIDQRNAFANGSSVVNNGNSNNTVIRQVSTGAGNTLKFGSDANSRSITFSDTDSANSFIRRFYCRR